MKKALILDLVSARIKNNDENFVEESDTSTVSVSGAIVRADSNGKIDADWIQGPIPISSLPVADDGETSSTELVRADDSRLANPDVGGDISGQRLNATVVGLQGRPLASTVPTDGQSIIWNNTQGRWEPGSSSGSDAISIQGNHVSSAEPDTGNVLAWNGSAWAPSSSSGSGGSAPPGTKMYLYERFW